MGQAPRVLISIPLALQERLGVIREELHIKSWSETVNYLVNEFESNRKNK